MLILENTIFTFNNRLQENSIPDFDEYKSPILGEDDNDNEITNNSTNSSSPTRHHRLSIVKANDPHAVAVYRRLSITATNTPITPMVPSLINNSGSYNNSSYSTTTTATPNPNFNPVIPEAVAVNSNPSSNYHMGSMSNTVISTVIATPTCNPDFPISKTEIQDISPIYNLPPPPPPSQNTTTKNSSAATSTLTSPDTLQSSLQQAQQNLDDQIRNKIGCHIDNNNGFIINNHKTTTITEDDDKERNDQENPLYNNNDINNNSITPNQSLFSNSIQKMINTSINNYCDLQNSISTNMDTKNNEEEKQNNISSATQAKDLLFNKIILNQSTSFISPNTSQENYSPAKSESQISHDDKKKQEVFYGNHEIKINPIETATIINTKENMSSPNQSRLNPSNNNSENMNNNFNTILTPSTFKAILSPDAIIDETSASHTQDDRFRLFNYSPIVDENSPYQEYSVTSPSVLFNNENDVNKEEFMNSDDDDVYSTKNSSEYSFSENKDMTMDNKNNLITTQSSRRYSPTSNDNNDTYPNNLDVIKKRVEIEERIKKELEEARKEEKIKNFAPNLKGLHGLWKESLGQGLRRFV